MVAWISGAVLREPDLTASVDDTALPGDGTDDHIANAAALGICILV